MLGVQSFSDEELIVQCEFVGALETHEAVSSEQKDLLVILNAVPDQGMLDEGLSREVVNRVQKLRKEASLVVQDPIEVFYKVLAPDGAGAGAGAKGGGANCKPPGAPADAAEAKADTERLCSVVESQRESIAKLIGKPFRPKAQLLEHAVVVAEATRAVQGAQIEITIARETPVVDAKRVAALGGGDGTLAEHVQQLLAAHEPVALKRALSASGGKLSARVDGKELQLQLGRDFTLSSLA